MVSAVVALPVLLSICFLLMSTIQAQRRSVCRISPRSQDVGFNDDFICNEAEVYPGVLIQDALIAGASFQDFVTDTANCHVDDTYNNLHYSTSLFYWNVCATKIVYLHRVWNGVGAQREICHVVDPQKIYFGRCLSRRCQLGYASIPNYYCGPSSFIKRKFLVFCTKSKVLKYYTAKLPTACCCKGFKCGLGK